MTREEANYYGTEKYITFFIEGLEDAFKTMAEIIGESSAREGVAKILGKQIQYYTEMRSGGFIYDSVYRRILTKIKEAQEKNKGGIAIPNAKSDEDIVPLEAYATESHRAGDLLIPGNLEELPALEVTRGGFVAPATIDLRDYCIQTRDQGTKPWCAAYSATSFKSNILWRKTDTPECFDPSPVYSWAKQNDGSPNSNGTTLNAALQALLEDGSFDKEICKVKVLRNINQIKYAIHKFGCCIAGLDVTTEWNLCNKNKSTISGKGNYDKMGGHAVLVCGYNRDGVIIQNSWGDKWGAYGFALITWEEVEREFLYGAVIDNCLYETRMN